MRGRSVQEFSDLLDSDLAWRKKELVGLNLLVVSTIRAHEKALVRRTCIPIFYAHWEGFVKEAATRYLAFINRQGLPAHELRSNFLTVAMHSRICEASRSGRQVTLSPVIESILKVDNSPLHLPYRTAVSTESNLNSDVLQNILYCTGISYSSYWITKALLLDASLLKTRNEIAHGGRTEVDADTYQQLYDFVVEILDAIRGEFENAALTSGFKAMVRRGNG